MLWDVEWLVKTDGGRRTVPAFDFLLGQPPPVRIQLLCNIKIGHVRLHDPDGERFRIPDSKTETGIREVQISPDLVNTIAAHLERLRHTGAPSGPDDYLIPNLHGNRMEYGRVEQIVREAAALASEKLAEKGLPPLRHTTPHTLRRTYISIAAPKPSNAYRLAARGLHLLLAPRPTPRSLRRAPPLQGSARRRRAATPGASSPGTPTRASYRSSSGTHGSRPPSATCMPRHGPRISNESTWRSRASRPPVGHLRHRRKLRGWR